MKRFNFLLLVAAILPGSALVSLSALADAFQPVSLLDGSQPSPAGGGGDSFLPVISADGRYVLFASTANNLVVNSNGNPIPALNLPRMNVFLRDRASNATALVSVNLSGLSGGNGDSFPVQISSNGQFVLFESTASDLVANDTNGAADVFLRDLVNGTTRLVSTNSNGGAGNGISRSSTMTPDGRYVAFVSAATNLVAGDTNRIADVFVRDMQGGTTVLASKGAVSTNSSLLSSSSEGPDITPDGRYVAFSSSATNLVPGVTKAGDVYVRDLVADTTTWASIDARTLLGTQNAISYNHAISADGNFVAYETSTNAAVGTAGRGLILRYNMGASTTDVVNTNATVPYANYDEIRSLAMTPDGRFITFVSNTNGNSGTTNCVYVWDAQSLATTLASIDLNGLVPAGTCYWPAIDPSGRYVSFLSSATNLVTNSLAGDYHLYVRDTQAGSTRLIAVDLNGLGAAISPATSGAVSSDGRFVAFETSDTSLAPNDRNHDYDVFLRDLTIDPSELVSVHDPALPSLTPNGLNTLSLASINADGRYVTFSSEADNLLPNDTNGCRDVFVRDRVLGTNLLVSVDTNGLAGDFSSVDSSISADGRYVAFTSAADNLVPGDTNKFQDVFLRDLQTSTTRLISVITNGTGSGNGASYSPAVSSDGRFVLFRSKASNLAPGPFSFGTENLFLRDIQVSNTYALTTTGVLYSAMSTDGRTVAFANATRVYLWDSIAATRIYTNSFSQTTGVGLSGDGNRLVYWSGSNPSSLNAVDRAAGSNWVMTTGYPASQPGFQFSANNRFMTYLSKPASSNPSQVYLYDFATRTSTLVSRHLNSPGIVNSNCDSPVIGVDGRCVVYRSSATDIVPESTNGIPQLFFFDRLAASTTLLTTNRFGAGVADNRSLAPLFSGDGQTFFFESWASDLAAFDFNHNSDLFAYTLLYATIIPGTAGQGPSVSWPAVPGAAYRVEYKDDLNDPLWHDSGGSITIVGMRAYFSDVAPASNQKFYRVAEF